MDMNQNHEIQIDALNFTATATVPWLEPVAARLDAVLPSYRDQIMGEGEFGPDQAVAFLLRARPGSPDAAIVAAANGIPFEGMPKSKWVSRRLARDPDSIREDATDIMDEITPMVAGVRVPSIPSSDSRCKVVVCMSIGLFRAYLRVDGALCEPGSPMAEGLGAAHWAAPFCRNLNRVLDEIQGYIQGDDGIEAYLSSMEDRELVDAIAAGAVMDASGRIPGYRPDWEPKSK